MWRAERLARARGGSGWLRMVAMRETYGGKCVVDGVKTDLQYGAANIMVHGSV